MQDLSQRRPTDWIFIGAGIAALAVALIASLAAPSAQLDWVAMALWLLLLTTAGCLVLDIVGGHITLTNLLAVSGLWMFGGAPALWLVLLGEIASDIVRTLLAEQLGAERRTAWRTLVVAANNAALQVASLSAGWLIFRWLGQSVPLSTFSTAVVLAALGAFIGYFLVNNLLFSVSVKLEEGEPIGQTFWRDWPIVARFDLLPLPLSLVIANVYLHLGLWSFAGLAIFLLGAMAVIYSLNQAEMTAQQRVRELTSLAAISQAMSASLDLPELLQAIHKQIGQMMDANNFYIALYDATTDWISFPLVYENGAPVRRPGRYAAQTNGMTEWILRTQKPCLIHENAPAAFRQLGVDSLGPPTESWLGVPILAGDKSLGVLAVHNPAQRRAYTSNHMAVLNTVAAQAAIAINNAQLYSTMRQRAHELAILNSVSTALSASLDLKRVARVLADSIGPIIGCQKAAFFLLNDDHTLLDLLEARGLSQAYVEKTRRIAIGAQEHGLAALTRSPILVPDIQADPAWAALRPQADAEGFRALAEAPLVTQNEIVGTLAAYYEQPHQFTQAELDLLITFANQAAAAVANARLYARTDQALARRIEELAVIEDMGRELLITLDVNRILQQMLERTMQVTGAQHGVVVLFDAALEEARLLAHRGYPPHIIEPLADQPWPIHMGITGLVLRTGQMVNLPNVQASPDYYAALPQVQSLLSAPIVREGQVLGAISLESDNLNAFDAQAVSFARHLANQAAIALTNARLYEEAHRRLREASILHEVSQQLTGILDLNLLTVKIVEQICKAMNSTSCLLEFWDKAADTLESAASYSAPTARQPITATPYSQACRAGDYPATARLLQTHEPLVTNVNDPDADPDEQRLLAASQQCAVMILPLVVGDSAIGIVECLDDRPRRFSNDEVRLAQTLANQAAIAIENARLFSERARRINELSQLYRASLALAGSLNPQEILDTIGAVAREITRSDAVILYLYDADADSFQIGTAFGASDALCDPRAIRPEGNTRRVVAEQRLVLIPDAQLDPSIHPNVLAAGLRASIYAPIVSRGQVVGVLIVDSRQPNAYSEDDVRLISALANQAAISIENSRLFKHIAETRDRLQAILNSTSEGMLMLDPDGRIVTVNPMLESLWQISHQALEGYLLEEVLDRPAMKIAGKLGLAPAAGEPPLKQLQRKIRVTFQTPPPSPRFIERTTTPVLGPGGKLLGWMLTLRDVTEERELQTMRDNLTSMIVHDLRSPLNAISNGLYMLRDVIANTPDADFGLHVISVSERSTRRLLMLVNSLLDVNKGHLKLNITQARLEQIVKGVMDMLAPLATDKGILLSAQLAAALPPVAVDEDKITNVLMNLVDNALKFTPAGGQVTVLAEAVGAKVRCSIRDNGAGIPAEYRESIFDLFFQVPDQQEQRRGTGVGLAFCKLAIEAHGEQIGVESEEGRGSTFYFTLPVYAP